MLLVIFGAGASYDSSPDCFPGAPSSYLRNNAEKLRPPLANKLFVDHELYRQFRTSYPQFLDLVGQLLPKEGKDDWSIEDILQRFDAEAASNKVRKSQLTAIRYYLRDLIEFLATRWLDQCGGASNYGGLIDQIENHRRNPAPVCFLTFSYDTLLESALTRFYGAKFEVIADYLSHKQFKVFKLHGSTDWGRTLEGIPDQILQGGVKAMIEGAANYNVSPQIITRASYGSRGNPLYPAIAIPVARKSVFECPQEHIGELEALLPQVTDVLTVGWRGNEEHFQAMLRKVGAGKGIRLVTVAGSQPEAVEVAEKIRALSIGLPYVATYAGFTEVVGSGSLDGFLKAAGSP